MTMDKDFAPIGTVSGAAPAAGLSENVRQALRTLFDKAKHLTRRGGAERLSDRHEPRINPYTVRGVCRQKRQAGHGHDPHRPPGPQRSSSGCGCRISHGFERRASGESRCL